MAMLPVPSTDTGEYFPGQVTTLPEAKNIRKPEPMPRNRADLRMTNARKRIKRYENKSVLRFATRNIRSLNNRKQETLKELKDHNIIIYLPSKKQRKKEQLKNNTITTLLYIEEVKTKNDPSRV